MVTSTASPRPNDNTTEGVSAPGRWMLAIARRSIGNRVRGSRRAIAISSTAMPRSSANTTTEEATNTAAMRLSNDRPITTAISSATTTAMKTR
ncbi:DNA-directed RNA polymerase specialized sigma24 family protein [Bradyrhizobium sp. LM3.2]